MKNLPSGNWALSIAHPGHELRLHGFLELARPFTFILTDNAEAKGQDLMWDSIKAIARATQQGLKIHPAALKSPLYRKALKVSLKKGKDVKEHIKDGEIQYEVANHRIDFFRYYLDYMVENLLKFDITHLLCDASEDYHLTHEVVRMVAELAVTRIKNTHGIDIELYEYALHRPYNHSLTEECVHLQLDEGMLERKLEAIATYPLGIQDLKPNINADQGVIDQLRKHKDGKEQIKSLLKDVNTDFFQNEYLRPVQPFEETDNYKTFIQPVYGKLLHSIMTPA